MRERLIEILKEHWWDDILCKANIELLADNLLESGIIVPPCKVGDIVWFETWEKNGTVNIGVKPHKIDRIDVTYVCNTDKLIETRIPIHEIGKRVFTSKEACEKAVNKNETH